MGYEDVYLAAGDRAGGSGYSGGDDGWRRARQVITAAVDRDGDFLDVGCANGLLMESLTAWARELGHRIEPHGLDISPRLARRARESLPQWSDRIHVGDVLTWTPPQRYDFVRTELLYVPRERRCDLVRRCLDEVVADRGRLIVCSYRRTDEVDAAPVTAELERCGFEVAGRAEALDNHGVVTRVVWMDRRPRGP